MKKLSKLIIVTVSTGLFIGGAFTQQASATLITGNIGFSAQVQYDTGDLNTADSVVRWGTTKVQAANGSFGGMDQNTTAIFGGPWNFDPSTPMAALWTAGGFTFDLLTSTIVEQGGGFLTISGTGIITSTNQAFDPTAVTWSFSQSPSNKNGRFNFSTGGSAVPEGGSALALLGIGLVAVETLRRRFGVSHRA